MKMDNMYIASNEVMPQELTTKPRGRGSAAFKETYGDAFCVLKEEHLKEIVEYVTKRNKHFKDICTVNTIITHLYAKFGIEFKINTVNYALKHRLCLKYRTPLKSRLVFTEGRNRLGIEFCINLDQALKEERAGTAVIVYMDDIYFH